VVTSLNNHDAQRILDVVRKNYMLHWNVTLMFHFLYPRLITFSTLKFIQNLSIYTMIYVYIIVVPWHVVIAFWRWAQLTKAHKGIIKIYNESHWTELSNHIIIIPPYNFSSSWSSSKKLDIINLAWMGICFLKITGPVLPRTLTIHQALDFKSCNDQSEDFLSSGIC
jgi:hypothetical protein